MRNFTNDIEKNKGVTMIALVITIVVLLILSSIVIKSGKNSIKKAKLEEIETNMLLIEAKAREYLEEASFKMGITPSSADKDKAKVVYESKGLKRANDGSVVIPGVTVDWDFYEVTPGALTQMGLDDIKINTAKGEKYIIRFDEVEMKAEVYNTIGFEGKYSLTDIKNINV